MESVSPRGIKFTDSDIVNGEEYIPSGKYSYNPHNIRGFLIHDHGFTIGIVFASCLQGALDELADQDKLDSFLIKESEYKEYMIDSDNPTCKFLGNASEPFDIDVLDYEELSNPPFSFCAIYNAHKGD